MSIHRTDKSPEQLPTATEPIVDSSKLGILGNLFLKLFSPETRVIATSTESRKRAIVCDIGTGDSGTRLQIYNPETGQVTSGTEEKISRYKDNDKKNLKTDEEFAVDIVASFEGEVKKFSRPKKIGKEKMNIYLTSHSRGPEKDKLFKLIKEKAEKSIFNIKVEIIDQSEEALIGHEAVMHHIKFKDTKNKELANLKEDNTAAFELGKGSGQSKVFLPKQTTEEAGNWGNEQLEKGTSLDVIADQYKEKLKKDLIVTSLKIENIAAQGLLGVGLSDKKLMERLGLTEDVGQENNAFTSAGTQTKWRKGQKLLKLSNIVTALEKEVADLKTKQENKQLLAKDAERAIPLALTLGTLKALQEKYNKDFNILNLKDPSELYYKGREIKDADGKSITAKASGTLGMAYKYFKEVHSTTNSVARWFFKHLLNKDQQEQVMLAQGEKAKSNPSQYVKK
jgi:hypothetical protein